MSEALSSSYATVEPSGLVSADFTGVIIALAGSKVEVEALLGLIKETQIEDGAISTPKLAANSVTAGKILANTITAAQIAAGTVTANEIKAATITAGEIAANTITAAKIAANTITAAEIKAKTITAGEIAAATVTSGELAAGAVATGNIAAGAVTAGKIAISELSALTANAGTLTAGTITGATIRTAAAGKRVVLDGNGLRAYNAIEQAVLNFDIATGDLSLKGTVIEGSVVPATTVTGKLTKAQIESIEAAQVTGQIKETQIEDNAVTTPKLKAGAVIAAKIAADTITAAEIAAGAITATELNAESVTTEKLKADAVTSAKILAETIVAGDIAANTITATQIAAETITGSRIAAGTIAASKLTVASLSAITADLGTVTTGTIESVAIKLPEETAKNNLNSVRWLQGGVMKERIVGVRDAAEKNHRLDLDVEGALVSASLRILAREKSTAPGTEAEEAALKVSIGGGAYNTILDESGRSMFLQLTASANRKINFGTVNLGWAGGTREATSKVTHGLGATPKTILAVPQANGVFVSHPFVSESNATDFLLSAWVSEFAVPAAGQVQGYYWLAIA